MTDDHDSVQEGSSVDGTSLTQLFFRKLPLETETSVFILVNMLDFFMTYWLMMTVEFEERNPVARFFLDHWGPIKGMLIYKLVMVTFVCLITQIIATQRLQTAKGVLWLGTLITFSVVIYSVRLYLHHA